MWVNQQKVTTLSSKTLYAAERGLRWRRAGVRQTLQERRAEVICRRGSDRYNCTRIRSGHPICDEGTGGTYDRSTTGSAVSITHEMTSFQRLSSSEYRLVVATGLICTLVDALTRPSTLNACLACFREPRGLPSPGDRARTRFAFSYNGGGRMDLEVPENGSGGGSSSSMEGNKLVASSGDAGAGDEENL